MPPQSLGRTQALSGAEMIRASARAAASGRILAARRLRWQSCPRCPVSPRAATGQLLLQPRRMPTPTPLPPPNTRTIDNLRVRPAKTLTRRRVFIHALAALQPAGRKARATTYFDFARGRAPCAVGVAGRRNLCASRWRWASRQKGCARRDHPCDRFGVDSTRSHILPVSWASWHTLLCFPPPSPYLAEFLSARRYCCGNSGGVDVRRAHVRLESRHRANFADSALLPRPDVQPLRASCCSRRVWC